MLSTALWLYILALVLLSVGWAGWAYVLVVRGTRPDFSGELLPESEAARVDSFRRYRNVVLALFTLGYGTTCWIVGWYGLGERHFYVSVLSLSIALMLLLAIPRCPRCGNRIYITSNGLHHATCRRCRVSFREASTGDEGDSDASS